MGKIVFTGGGTLGHVMPNLYLIEELKDENEVFYIGSNGIEKDKVKENNIKYYEISATKLFRGKFARNLSIPFKLISSINQAKKVLKEINPDLVVSKGGYVSLPVCIAARKLRIPIISHESDYSFGLANKIILKVSNVMCVNFEHLTNVRDNIVYTGPIISNSFKLTNIKSDINFKLNPNKPTILFIGGSSGSKKINDAVIGTLPRLLKIYNIIHIVGKGNITKAQGENYNQMEICCNMPYVYSISDLVVGRAGAGVIFESAFMQKPMLLIPLQNKNSRGDQVQNANYFKSKGGARVLTEAELNPITLYKHIELALKDLDKMKSNLKKMDLTKGKDKMLKIIKENLKK